MYTDGSRAVGDHGKPVEANVGGGERWHHARTANDGGHDAAAGSRTETQVSVQRSVRMAASTARRRGCSSALVYAQVTSVSSPAPELVPAGRSRLRTLLTLHCTLSQDCVLYYNSLNLYFLCWNYEIKVSVLTVKKKILS